MVVVHPTKIHQVKDRPSDLEYSRHYSRQCNCNVSRNQAKLWSNRLTLGNHRLSLIVQLMFCLRTVYCIMIVC